MRYIRFEMAKPKATHVCPHSEFGVFMRRNYGEFGPNGLEVIDWLVSASHRHPPPDEAPTQDLWKRKAWFWFKATPAAQPALEAMDRALELAAGTIVRYDSATPPGDVLWEDEYQICAALAE